MIVFCDIETTGLDPQRHAITEVAFIKGEEVIEAWIELSNDEFRLADSMALKVNHYWSREPMGEQVHSGAKRNLLANRIARFTDRAVLAGNNVKFDQQFLEVWLRKHGACPTWDYHVLDVPTFAAGFLRRYYGGEVELEPPFKSNKISQALGVGEPEGDDKHTAMADARWSQAIYNKVLSL